MVGSIWNFFQRFEIWAGRGAQSELVFGGSETRFKFFKFGIRIPWKLFQTKNPGISFDVDKIEVENVQVGFTPDPEPSEQFFFDLEK